MTELLQNERAQRVAGWVYLVCLAFGLLCPASVAVLPQEYHDLALFAGVSFGTVGMITGRVLPRPMFMRLSGDRGSGGENGDNGHE